MPRWRKIQDTFASPNHLQDFQEGGHLRFPIRTNQNKFYLYLLYKSPWGFLRSFKPTGLSIQEKKPGPGYGVKLLPAVTLNECWNVRLPSITVASPPSGLQGCHNLGGRARWQSSTDRWLTVLAIMVWQMILFFVRTTTVREWSTCSDAVKVSRDLS